MYEDIRFIIYSYYLSCSKRDLENCFDKIKSFLKPHKTPLQAGDKLWVPRAPPAVIVVTHSAGGLGQCSEARETKNGITSERTKTPIALRDNTVV